MPEDGFIHPERISERPKVLAGAFHPADLERLEDSLADERGELRYRITAVLDRQRRKTVSCIIEGFVFLTCQTSLEAFRYDLALHERLVLVDTEEQLPSIEEEDDSEDYVVAGEPLDIRDLVEDAVLLALPMIPRKPGVGEPKQGEDSAVPAKESPFAALASLRKRNE